MKNGREKQFYILSLINKRVRKPKTISELRKMFSKELAENKIPNSTFIKIIYILIKEKRVSFEKKVIPQTKSRAPIYLIAKLKTEKQNGSEQNAV